MFHPPLVYGVISLCPVLLVSSSCPAGMHACDFTGARAWQRKAGLSERALPAHACRRLAAPRCKTWTRRGARSTCARCPPWRASPPWLRPSRAPARRCGATRLLLHRGIQVLRARCRRELSPLLVSSGWTRCARLGLRPSAWHAYKALGVARMRCCPGCSCRCPHRVLTTRLRAHRLLLSLPPQRAHSPPRSTQLQQC